MNLHRNLQIAKAVVASTVLAVLAGCDGTNATEVLHVPQPVVATTYVANAGGVDRRDVYTTLDADDNPLPVDDTTTIATGIAGGGVVLDQAANLVQAGGTSIRTFCSARTLGATPAADSFREITGVTGQIAAIDIAHEVGAYIVTNGTSTAEVYASGGGAAAGSVAQFTTSGSSWGVAYDDVADRLFVANTEGTIDIFEDFVADSFGQTAANRRTLDTGLAGGDGDPETVDETGTVDFRGIAYDPQGDRLVVGDIGATDGTDGRILVINNASTASGGGTDPGTSTDPGADPFLIPDLIVQGPATGLGDPMALTLKGVALDVADSGTDQILSFSNIFAASSDGAPTASIASTAPEGIAVDHRKTFPTANDVGGGTNVIAYVNNETGATQVQHYSLDHEINPLASQFDAAGNTFDTGEAQVGGLDFDPNGDGYIAFDDGAGTGGVAIVHRLAKGRDGETGTDADRDRIITGLENPTGVAVLGNTGMFAVAENGATNPGIYVYYACGESATPITTVDTTAQPWDLDYDAASDLLFVAFTDGTFQIYRNFVNGSANSVAAAIATPATEIAPLVTVTLDDGVTSATNLHGVRYRAGNLILSDVGATGDFTDGRIWVVRSVTTLITYVRDPAQDGTTTGTDAISTLTLPIRVEDDCQDDPAVGACTPTVGTATNPSPDDDDGDGDPSDADELPEFTNDPYLVTGTTVVLGNPVDVALDGSDLYVANKTGVGAAEVLLYERFVTRVLATADPTAGAANFIPVTRNADDSVADTNVEAVSMVPDAMSTAP